LNKPVQAGGSLPSLALAQQQLIKMPYAAFLGVSLRVGPDGLETSTRSRADLIGNTNLPALHGGVIGSLLDITGMLTLVFLKALDQSPRLIDMDIDYLRSGQAPNRQPSSGALAG
jgi:acyl-coenzyme A thioesterase PaaI-like protein